MAGERKGIGIASLGLLSLLTSVAVMRGSPRGQNVPPPQSRAESAVEALAAAAVPDDNPPDLRPGPAQRSTTTGCPLFSSALDEAKSQADGECMSGLRELLESWNLCEPTPVPGRRAIVATIADPLDSRLSYAADEALSALVLAAEVRGSLVDRSIPWLTDRGSSSALSIDLIRAQGRTTIRGHERSCRLEVPGALVFRGQDGATTVIFVVGEIPTSGVHQRAMRLAIALASRLDARRNVYLVAPQFSGSSPSIRAVLTSAIEEHPELSFRVISGSATSPRNKTLLTIADNASFAATVAPDDEAMDQLYEFLVRAGIARANPKTRMMANVAVLTEADTVYGQQTLLRDQAPRSDPLYRPNYQILFPIHVSDLRAAWEKEGASRETAGTMASVPRVALRVDLQEHTSAKDDVPTFSNTSAVYDERTLSLALALLAENKIDVVGIIATDPRDKIFLAESVRRKAPDAQLFTLESDVLLAHPDYEGTLRGALVASSYPLVAANQTWSLRGAVTAETMIRRQFGTSASQGTFNAAVVALAEEQFLSEYAGPRTPGLSLEDGADHPPLWLSTVGAGAFWPVAVMPIPDKNGYMYRHTGTSSPVSALIAGNLDPVPDDPPVSCADEPFPRIPRLEMNPPGSIVIYVLCAVVLWLCIRLMRVLRGAPDPGDGAARFLQPFVLLTVSNEAQGRPVRRLARRLAAALIIAVLLLMVLLGTLATASIAFRFRFLDQLHRSICWNRDIDGWQLGRLVAVSLTNGALLWALACVSSDRLLRDARRHMAISTIYFISASVAGGLLSLGLAVVAFLGPSFGLDIGSGIFQYWRAIHLRSWVSPLWPTAMMAVIVVLALNNALRVLYIDEQLAAGALKHSPASGEDARIWSGFPSAMNVRRGAVSLWLVGGIAGAIWVLANARGLMDGKWGAMLLPLVLAIGILAILVGMWQTWVLAKCFSAWTRSITTDRLLKCIQAERTTLVRLLGTGTAMRMPDRMACANAQRKLELACSDLDGAPALGVDTQLGHVLGAWANPGLASKPLCEFVALRYAMLVAAAVSRMRGAWYRVSLSAVLFVLTIAFYPLHPQKEFLAVAYLVIFVVVIGTVLVLFDLNRNELLSTLSGTTANEVTWSFDFIERLVPLVGFPIFGLIAAQFPEVFRALGSLVEPLLRGIH